MELSELYDHNMSNKMPKQEVYLPIDVMTNILKRLPLISIIRSQAVSKYWHDVIHDHGILSARPNSSLMTVQLATNIVCKKLTLFKFNHEGYTTKKVRDINLGSTMNCCFSNVVNGLVCAHGSKTSTTFYLINLTTFETSKFSKRKIVGKALSYDKISLGFDPSKGLYKFVRIYSRFISDPYRCEVLEVGVLFKGDWKIIGEVPCDVDLDNPVFFNGGIHWKLKSDRLNIGNSRAFDLLKFDVKEETFEMVAPDLHNEFKQCEFQVCNCSNYFNLTEQKGTPYVLHYCRLKKCLDGWGLKENKIYRVWKVVFHIDISSVVERTPYCLLGYENKPYVLGIVDDKVLIRSKISDKGVYIYDLLLKKLTKHWHVHDVALFIPNMN